MEEPGEHPYCGDGIIPRTGFSYDPETFMNSGIQYFNLLWEDLTIPNHEKTIKICQIMHHIIVRGGNERKNKILVHCHAGQGRTAIIIGAYLLYSYIAKNADEAIRISQDGRSKLFINAYNKKYLYEFETFLK